MCMVLYKVFFQSTDEECQPEDVHTLKCIYYLGADGVWTESPLAFGESENSLDGLKRLLQPFTCFSF